MARAISQETFDQVVRENVEDLDMTLEEAAQDAIQQFKAQGVDLGNIITDPIMRKDSEKEIIECISRLSVFKYVEGVEPDLLSDLNTIRKWCDQGIQFRLLAASFKAYETLITVLSQATDKESIVTHVLKTFTSLMTGYPDLLSEDGANAILTILNTNKNADCLVAALQLAQACCLKHEKNRQRFSNREIHNSISPLLQHPSNSVLIETCDLIKTLTLDDDIREQISRAHEHARLLAVQNLGILCELLGRNRNEMTLVPHILGALSSIVVRNEFCEQVDQAGGIIHILDILAAHPDIEKVNSQCLKMIKVLAGNDDVKLHLMQSGASPLLLAAMSRHKGSSLISAAGCSCIAALALRCPDNAQILVDNGAADALIDALKIHKDNTNVQRVACLAIRNLVSRNKELCSTFLSLGAEDLLNAVDKAACWDEAKAALRDMGCNVKLEEPFKGKGVKLSN